MRNVPQKHGTLLRTGCYRLPLLLFSFSIFADRENKVSTFQLTLKRTKRVPYRLKAAFGVGTALYHCQHYQYDRRLNLAGLMR